MIQRGGKILVALIVLNYNDYKTTKCFLEKTKDIASIDKIVVVDNCSNDDSYKLLKHEENTRIIVLQTSMNKGYSSGNNYGIKFAIDSLKADILIVANPDVEIPTSTATNMINFIRNNRNVGVVSGRMECCKGTHLPIATKLPKFKDCILENFFILKKIKGSTLDYPKSYWNRDLAQVDVIPGSLFAISSETYKKIEGLDENTFLYYEEPILAFKLKQAGYKNYILTNSPYLHYHSVSINKNITSYIKRFKIAHESRKYYCKEYLKINKIEELLLVLSFYVGLTNYIFANFIIKGVSKKNENK